MALVDVPVQLTDPNVDADIAAKRLQELDVKSGPLLEPFFGRAKAAGT
jgi:hypothetical protein